MISALIAPGVGAAAVSSCGGPPQIAITLQDRDELRETAAFAEVLVYPKGCPSLGDLSTGNIGTPLKRQVVEASESFEPVGELEPASYGIAALLRRSDCAVLASGCAVADLSSVRTVVIPVGAVIPPKGACTGGAMCVDAACEGGDGGQDSGGGGFGCPASLVMAGKLPKLIQPGGTATGPAVIASDTGFLLAYREATIDTTVASATLLEIGDDGTLGMVSRQNIPTCVNFVADDGVALLEGQTGGFVVASRPACVDAGAGAGFTLIPFDASLALGAPVVTPDVGGISRFALSHAAIAFEDGAQAFFIADGVAYQSRVGTDGSLVSVPIFPGNTSTFAQIAATPTLWARLADRRIGATGDTLFTVGPPRPIAAPGGTGGAGGAGGGSGVGGGGGTMDASPPPQSEFTVIRSLADWGAVAAWSTPAGDRAIAASMELDGTVTWGAIDHAGLPLGTGTLGVKDPTVQKATDVVVLRDHAFVVAARARGFRLWKLNGALGKTLVQDGLGVDHENVVGNENLGNYDGVRVAIAAARNRVIVTWITRKQLGTTDETGGFALYACDE